MESNATDKPVPREIIALLSDERLILRETQRVTPFVGIAVFIAFLGKIGFVEAVRQHMPIRWRSPNQIDPTFTFTAPMSPVDNGVEAATSQFGSANHSEGSEPRAWCRQPGNQPLNRKRKRASSIWKPAAG